MYKWLSLVIAIRAISAFCSPIMDCDETFNYLEPLHYIMYGTGLQPWEYVESTVTLCNYVTILLADIARFIRCVRGVISSCMRCFSSLLLK